MRHLEHEIDDEIRDELGDSDFTDEDEVWFKIPARKDQSLVHIDILRWANPGKDSIGLKPVFSVALARIASLCVRTGPWSTAADSSWKAQLVDSSPMSR